MLVRLALQCLLARPRGRRILALVAGLLAGAGGPSAASGAVGARVTFDRDDLRIATGPSGSRVVVQGLVEASGDGLPALPMAVRTFYVPAGYEVREVRAVAGDEVAVASGVRLARRSAAIESDLASAVRPFPDGAVDGSGVFPARSSVSLGGGTFGGHRVHSVALFPVRWNESTGELTFTRTFDVEVELAPASPSDALVRRRSAPSAERAFRDALAAIVANPSDLPAPADDEASAEGGFTPRDLPSVEGSAVDMVILTTAALEAAWEPLADWKTKKGVPTVIRTVEWVDANYPLGHDRPERIRLFLQDAYSQWGTFLVLLGGDHAEVTPRHAWNRFFFGGREIPTDQYYACLEGDWNADGDGLFGEGVWQGQHNDQADLYPDVFVGRAPVSTVAEVQTFLAKGTTYEKSPPAGYVEQVNHMAEVLFPSTWEFGVDPPESIDTDGKMFSLQMDARIDPSWGRFNSFQSENTLSRPLALARLSTGYHLMTLMSHGDAFKFSAGNGLNPLVHIADTDTLSNGDRFAVVLATACNPNQFDLESCGESLMNNPDGGAVVCIGPTRVDFPASAAAFHYETLELWFSHGITGFGASTQVNRAHFAPICTTDGTPDRWTMLTKNLLGDPELSFWTHEPETFVVTHAASVPIGTASITVTVTDGASPVRDAVVCVSAAAGTYSRARTNAAGQAVLPLGSSAPGTADVVVTKPGFIPDEGTFTIGAVGGPVLVLTTHTIDDDGTGASIGNGDGRLDGSERIELGVTVHNGGGGSAANCQVNATVEPGTEATFNLVFEGSSDPANVYVGPFRTHPATNPFTLDFASPSIDYLGAPNVTFASDTTAGDRGIFVWQDRQGWHLWWSDGVDSTSVSGTITTDGLVRGWHSLALEAGQDAVTISPQDVLTFSGTTHSADLFDTFDFAMSDDTNLTLVTSSASLGSISAGTNKSATLVMDVSPNVRNGQIAYLDLTFTSTTPGGPWKGVVPVDFSAPALDAYVFTVDDDATPPSSGNGNGIIQVGETVVLVPTVFNSGDGAAENVTGAATAGAGISFGDAGDPYGAIAPLAQTSGSNGYRFTVLNGSGTSINLVLLDAVGRTWAKTIEFLAPAAPESLAFTSTPTAITLSWKPNGEPDLAGYNVYRSVTSGGPWTKKNVELVRAGARWVDEGLSVGAQFHYRATAVDLSGNEGPASSAIPAWTTLPQAPGWPQFATGNIFSSVGMADTKGDGQKEIYIGSNDLAFYAWGHDGDGIEGFPVHTQGEVWTTPGFGDVDGDGDLEIVFGSLDWQIYAVHGDGSPVYGATPNFFSIPSFQGARTAPAFANLDADQELEFVIGNDHGTLYAFDNDGTGLLNPSAVLFQVTPPGINSRIWGSIAVGNLDFDSTLEIGFCSWNDTLYVIEPDGTLEPGFPRGATMNYRSGPVFADLDADGTKEVLAGNDDGRLYAYNHDGSNYAPGGILATMPSADGGVRCVPAVANIDGDPQLEVFVSNMDGRLYGFQHNGTGILNPNGLFADIDSTKMFSASPIVVDVDGDLDMEILVGHRNFKFYGFHHDGTRIVGMPIPTANEIYSTAAAGDLDGDGFIDVAFASYDASVNVIPFSGPSTPAAYEWATYAGNIHRTSTYGDRGPEVGIDPAVLETLQFVLRQNSPNPFGRETTIRWVVPQDGPVTLRVFDVAGRLVRTLVNESMAAGPGAVVWDGRDGEGRRLATGVYFYRLDATQGSVTRKSLLLK